jgi:hypothetical protein
MWLKWFPWQFIVKQVARSKGFIDPILLLSHFNRFAQPSEVWVPVELLRAGTVLHARGLINSQVIQHNLDWVWPYWVERQFDPEDKSFIPRAFSLTQINLTHRNWTAVGVPGYQELPVVDPRGLVMPFFDSWSIDSWVALPDGGHLIPSREKNVQQKVQWTDSLSVITKSENDQIQWESEVKVILDNGIPVCRIYLKAKATTDGFLLIALRPYNPEGVSFIQKIELLKKAYGWFIDRKYLVFFDEKPEKNRFSHYRKGDVYHWIFSPVHDKQSEVQCEVGMATALAAYSIKAGEQRYTAISIPLEKGKKLQSIYPLTKTAHQVWQEAYEGCCQIHMPYRNFEYLYEAAIRTLLLHTPRESYAGPYTYKRFWFRDAAFTVKALLCTAKTKRAAGVIDTFFEKQKSDGYFLSQDGEWDSNGEALWAMQQYCLFSGQKTPNRWKDSVMRAAEWIINKRVKTEDKLIYNGLFPSGFSAEHLGPNDFYFWDDFWGVAGLNAAAFMARQWEEYQRAENFESESRDFMNAIVSCLEKVAGKMRKPVMPASPYRRPDSGAVGSLAAGYPLQLWNERNERLLLTADHLFKNCLINNGFYHDISHSGINPYLTLHIAQVLMRAGDIRFRTLTEAIAEMASPTGQWPEAIHPRLKSGCMGDGQHVWAASEWILMVRNSFLREERDRNTLVLCSGIYKEITDSADTIRFGPALSYFGSVSIQITRENGKLKVHWDGKWYHGQKPEIEIAFPEKTVIKVEPGKQVCHIQD